MALNHTLTEAQIVRGTVKDSQSGTPIRHAAVNLVISPVSRAEITTGQTGAFTLEVVEPGHHILRVEAEGYMACTQDVFVSGKAPTAHLNIRLTRGEGEIAGRVSDNYGDPIRAEVVLLKNGVIVMKTFSDENRGSYIFRYLVEGVYEIQTSATCHSPRGWLGHAGGSDAKRSTTVNFELPAIENCVTIGKCDVCLQANKPVRYCKFCHAYICNECRLNYPDRIKAMLRRRFSDKGKSANESELEQEYEKMLKEKPTTSRANCCT